MSHNNNEGKNPEYVARGLKAALHNNGVSDEAKESAAERLQQMGADVPEYESSSGVIAGEEAEYVPDDGEEYRGRDTNNAKGGNLNSNQQRGYKATLKNPNVSDRAKQHAEQVLEDSGASY